MARCGRIAITALLASLFITASAAQSPPSSDSEAGRKYSIACQRLSELKRSKNRRKYRSYWIDCARIFESVEKRYPGTRSAGDACFERAGLYYSLYQYNRSRSDLSDSIKTYSRCIDSYPKHDSVPLALFRLVEINIEIRKNRQAAISAYERLYRDYPANSLTRKAKAWLGLGNGNGKDMRSSAPKATVAKPDTPAKVSAIRHWSGGTRTRIVIDMDRPFRFEALELRDPPRLSFDIKKANMTEELCKVHEPLMINDGILRQVRFSQFDQETVRVVLDVASIKSYSAFPLREPDRLVIDISGDSVRVEPGQADPGRTEDGHEEGEGEDTASGSGKSPKSSPQPFAEQLSLKVETIAIDAGHGGHDPGAIGRRGLKEKDVTLDISRRLAQLVRERLGIKVVMTRDRDVFVKLDDRPGIAIKNKADLFVSIHANANRRHTARGIETYIQGIHATDRDAMATAARENATSMKTLSELNDVVKDMLKGLTMTANDEESIKLAHAVHSSLLDNVKLYQKSVVDLGVKRAFFYVLVNSQIPSILAEVGFISNPEEERLLRQPEYRQKIAEALFDGIKKFVESRAPQMAGA